MLLTLLSLKLWVTPVVASNSSAGMKFTMRVTPSIYAKVRVFDDGLDIATAARTGGNMTIRTYVDFDF